MANDIYVGGNMAIDIKDRFPHYSNSVFGSKQVNPKFIDPPFKCTGSVGLYEWPNEGSHEDYYAQVLDFYKHVLDDGEREHLSENLAFTFSKISEDRVVNLVLSHFEKVDKQWADLIRQKLSSRKEGKTQISESEKITKSYQSDLLGVNAIRQAL